jgi:hypothetical protein
MSYASTGRNYLNWGDAGTFPAITGDTLMFSTGNSAGEALQQLSEACGKEEQERKLRREKDELRRQFDAIIARLDRIENKLDLLAK